MGLAPLPRFHDSTIYWLQCHTPFRVVIVSSAIKCCSMAPRPSCFKAVGQPGPNLAISGDQNPRVARLLSPEQQSLGQTEGYQLSHASSVSGKPRVLRSVPSHRPCSGSPRRSFTSWCRSSVPGAPCFSAVGHPGPNWPVSADRDPRERGSRPLNSYR